MKIINKFSAVVAATLMFTTVPAMAQIEQYKDYDVSDQVWNITTVKVDANMGDYYLEGLRSTWIASNEVAKKLGQIEEYSIYASDLPQAGEFNMLLIVKFSNTADLAPNKGKYDAFMKEWGETMVAKSRKTSMELYPKIRSITGEYYMRKVTVK